MDTHQLISFGCKVQKFANLVFELRVADFCIGIEIMVVRSRAAWGFHALINFLREMSD